MSWELSKIFRKHYCTSAILPLFLFVPLFSGLLGNPGYQSATPVISSDSAPETIVKTVETISALAEKPSFDLKTSYLTASNTRQKPTSTTSEASTKTSKSSSQTTNAAATTTATLTSSPSSDQPQGAHMTIGGRALSILSASSTTVNPGDKVARYGDKFYYGHRASAFSGLSGLSIGVTFTITSENGTTTTYRVANIATLNHSQKDANGKSEVDRHMNALVQGRYNGGSYDVVLMTCAGESLGGGDATDRLVVFANRL